MDDPTTTGAGPFSGRLLRDEKVIWRGRPQQGFLVRPIDALLIPFSLVWGGFTIFWEANVLGMPHAPVFMKLFGAVFVLIGLFLIVGRFFVDAWVRAGVYYALTDRRILILRSRPFVSFQSVSLDRLPEATVTESSKGRGTIRFGPALTFWNNRSMGGYGAAVPSLDPTPQFLGIENAAKVFAAIQERAQAGS